MQTMPVLRTMGSQLHRSSGCKCKLITVQSKQCGKIILQHCTNSSRTRRHLFLQKYLSCNLLASNKPSKVSSRML